MLDQMRAFITANPILAASLASLWGAILLDLVAFARSKAPGDFFQQFSWQVAAWKYAQSLVAGFVGNFVLAGGSALVTGLLIWSIV